MKHIAFQIKLQGKAVAAYALVVFALLAVLVSFVGLSQKAQAAAGIYKTLNFQGKVVNTNGTNVADATYTFRFRIYTSSSGDTGSPCLSTCTWEETKSLTTVNGIFQTNLGDTTALPGSVNFNTDTQYVSVLFNGDTEMAPRIRLTSVPYAFNSDMLDGLDSTQLVQLTPAAQQTGTINVSGNITSAASVNAASFDANTATALQIGGSNATSITLAKNTNLSSSFTMSIQGNNALSLGSTTAAAGIVFKDGTVNNRAVTISTVGLTASYSLNLPSTGPSAGLQCLQTASGSSVNLAFGSCGAGGTNVSLQAGTPGTPDTGNFNVSGVGIAASFSAASFDQSTAALLNIGSTTASQVSIARSGVSTTIAGSLNTQDVSVTTNKSISYVSGSGNFDQSLATGTFKTGTGAVSLNGDVTVATGKFLTLTGSGTRPGTPTAGMLYYDTGTNQLVQYNGTKWVSDRTTSTKIVAASNSSQANKDAADYVATGTGDQSTINTALTAASGGLVYLMEGTYNETAAISIPNNTTLAGAGAGTLITIVNAQNGSYNLITNTDTSTGTHVTIRDLQIDGNKTNQTSGSMTGIFLNGMGGGSGGSARDGGKITNIYVSNVYNGNGIYLGASNNNTITGNTTKNNNSGIITNAASNNAISNNISQGNLTGIYVFSASTNNAITSNIAQGNSTYGIILDSSSNINTIGSNKLLDNGGATTNNGIYLTAADSNTIIGNDITDTSCSTNCYAINIFNSTSDTNYISSNRHTGSAANASTINDAGSGTIFANQQDGSGNLINSSQGGGFTVGAASAAASLSLQGGIKVTALPAPTLSATVTNVGTAGATTYRYQLTALDGLGETTGSTIQQTTTGNATLSVANYNTITWAQVGGAYQYKVYRCTGAACTPALLATVAGNTVSYNDQAAGAPSGAVPVINTTGGGNFAGLIQGSLGLTVSGAAANINASGTAATNIGNTTGALTVISGGTSSWANTTGGLTISTVTSGALAVNSAGTLALSGTNFGLATTGVLTLAGAQAADITTTAGAAPTALVFQPGNNTSAAATGAAFTLQAGGESGGSGAIIGGLLTLKGGNSTGAGTQTGGGVTIDSGNGASGGLVSISGTNASGTTIGKASNGVTLTLQGGASSIFSGTNATGTTVFGFAAPSTAGTVTYQLPAGGTGGNTYGVCTTFAVCTGYAPSTGSSSYIQNQNAGVQTTSNFWISGTGRADTSILTPLLDTATGVPFNIGTGTASAVNLGRAAAALTVASGGTSAWTNTSGNLTVSTVTTGNIAINSVGTLALSGTNFGLATTGVLTLAGNQTIDITTAAGTAPTSLVFQPGNNTTTSSTGASFTLQAGNDSGATASTGGVLTLKGGNGTGAGTKTGGAVVIDSGTGTTAGGAVTIGTTSAASVGIGRSGITTTNNGALIVLSDTTIKSTSTTALTIQNAAGSATLFAFDTSGGNVTIGSGATRTIAVGAAAASTAGSNLNVTGGASGAGGNTNGGNLVISGGAGTGTGVQGLVNLATSAFSSSSVQTNTIAAGIVDQFSSIPVTANTTGLTVTVPSPVSAVTGRILYVTAAGGSNDFTLFLSGTSISIAMKQNSTATLIWNGTGWTAAGASSSTDLQSAYNNTLTSAGGAEIVLNGTGGNADGFTIRNNSASPIAGGLLEVQASIGTNLLSVNYSGTELAANGGAETSGTFATDWTASGAPTIGRNTTLANVATGQASAQVSTTAAANTGVINNLAANPTVSSTYMVSFTGKLNSGTFSTLDVQYSRNGGANLVACGTYSTQTLVTTGWSKVTCTFTTDGTTATNPDLIIRQTDATSRIFWIDNLSVTILTATSTPPNVQIGGGLYGGPATVLTLDRASSAPVANGNTTLLGSMYYDTTSGRIQCYEADGWGACGSSPDNYVNLVPEFPGAVLGGPGNGGTAGIGTLTADFCANQAAVLVYNTGLCSTGQALNFYKWTSPQATQQVYSIYVTYQLPAAFKQFQSDTTVQLTARTDNTTNGIVTYEMFRSQGGALTACGTETTVTSSINTWQTVGINGNELSGCGFSSASANNFAIFKINVKANSNANVYVGTLSFTTTGQ